VEIALILTLIALMIWMFLWMRAQKPVTSAQALIQQGRYEEAVSEADPLHRGEALKLLGRFDEAAQAFREAMSRDPGDAAAREGLALSMAHTNRDLPASRTLMEETIALYPEIQEFQALSLSWILLRMGQREDALRLYQDNSVLLQTRFSDDYTDPDDLLAETLFMYGTLAREAEETVRAAALFEKVKSWAPDSVFARMAGGASP
jgi:tetratricopeptide (TPR) repeat protein